MNVIDPGHWYQLQQLDNIEEGVWEPVRLRFVKREGIKYPGNVGTRPGTTMQEVLRACIDRAYYVHKQIPDWRTAIACSLMIWAVWLLEWRAAARHKRPIPGIRTSLYGKTCAKCGHVGHQCS